MGRLFAILAASALALILAACPFTNLPPGNGGGNGPNNDKIFDMSVVTGISITVTVDEWNKFLAYYDAIVKHESLVRARVDITKGTETQSFEEVGLGLRGNTSRHRPEYRTSTDAPAYWYQQWNNGTNSFDPPAPSVPHNPTEAYWSHAHFKIDFNEFVPGQEYEGIDKLNLKWFKDDPTRTKEIYSYDLFRRFGVTSAPRVSYANLVLRIVEADGSVTEAPFGAYEMLEAIDNDYLRAREVDGTFESADGYLFKCLYPAPLTGYPEWAIGVEEIRLGGAGTEAEPFVNTNWETYPYDLKAPKEELPAAKAALLDFIDKLNNYNDADFAAWIPTVMDIDTFLKTVAVTVSVGMWDDYWYNNQNYYLYFEKSGKVTMIPYDYDNTLGTGLKNWQTGETIFEPGTTSPLEWGQMTDRPLITRILAIPEYMAAYRAHLADLMDPAKDYFDPDKSITRCLAWRSLIETTALADITIGPDPAGTWDEDAPPDWGFVRDYRVLSGDDNEAGATPNFFRVRKKFILQTLADVPEPTPTPVATPTPTPTATPTATPTLDPGTAPELTVAMLGEWIPSGRNIAFNYTLDGTGNVAAIAYLSTIAGTPTAEQIFQGLAPNGSAAAAHTVGAQAAAGTSGSLWLTGLTPNTSYHWYAVSLSADMTAHGSQVYGGAGVQTAPLPYDSALIEGGVRVFRFYYPYTVENYIYLNGINGWNHAENEDLAWRLSDEDGDRIYEISVDPAIATSGTHYKFTVAPNGWHPDAQNLNSADGTNPNSIIP